MTAAKKTPKRGRPRRSKKVSAARLVARCSEAELAEAHKAAEELGETLSDFVRYAVGTEVRRVAKTRAARNYERVMKEDKWPPSRVDF